MAQLGMANATQFEPALKLLSPQPRVAKTLAMTGFDTLLEQFDDRQTAVNSFS